MSKPRTYRLGQLQLEIMRVLWSQGPATVSDVQRSLPDSTLAYTTVATMLRKMESRGLVTHDVQGRTFVYRAAVGERDVTRSMADDLLDRLFAGSLSDMVSHLLSTHEISRDELRKLEALIAARKKQP
jgi:predicted transcriptional regulator